MTSPTKQMASNYFLYPLRPCARPLDFPHHVSSNEEWPAWHAIAVQ